MKLKIIDENELKSLEFEVEHNSCKKIGEERYKRINQRIGELREHQKFANKILELYTKEENKYYKWAVSKPRKDTVQFGKECMQRAKEWKYKVLDEIITEAKKVVEQ